MLQGVSWEELAKNLPIGGNALRIAFKRNNVRKIYLDEIRKVLKIEVDAATQAHQARESLYLTKDGVGISLNEIACFAEDNHDTFFDHKYFKREIELRVAKRLIELASDAGKFKEFLRP